MSLHLPDKCSLRRFSPANAIILGQANCASRCKQGWAFSALAHKDVTEYLGRYAAHATKMAKILNVKLIPTGLISLHHHSVGYILGYMPIFIVIE